jgi:hypothetical protein
MDKYKKDYLKEFEQKPSDIPWYGKERLDPVSYRWWSTWWGSSGWLLVDWWSITITWTWNYTISWMSFQPKYIEFVFLMWDMAFWQGKCYSSLTQFSWYSVWTVLQAELTSTYSVYARSTEWNLRVRAKVTSITAGWFVLNNDFHDVYQTKVFYTCFW